MGAGRRQALPDHAQRRFPTDFDLDLAVSRSNDNRCTVQAAHASVQSEEKARSVGRGSAEADFSSLTLTKSWTCSS